MSGSVIFKGNFMKMKTFEIDGFEFEWFDDPFDQLFEDESNLCWWI
jgi:hypothetical protein